MADSPSRPPPQYTGCLSCIRLECALNNKESILKVLEGVNTSLMEENEALRKTNAELAAAVSKMSGCNLADVAKAYMSVSSKNPPRPTFQRPSGLVPPTPAPLSRSSSPTRSRPMSPVSPLGSPPSELGITSRRDPATSPDGLASHDVAVKEESESSHISISSGVSSTLDPAPLEAKRRNDVTPRQKATKRRRSNVGQQCVLCGWFTKQRNMAAHFRRRHANYPKPYDKKAAYYPHAFFIRTADKHGSCPGESRPAWGDLTGVKGVNFAWLGLTGSKGALGPSTSPREAARWVEGRLESRFQTQAIK